MDLVEDSVLSLLDLSWVRPTCERRLEALEVTGRSWCCWSDEEGNTTVLCRLWRLPFFVESGRNVVDGPQQFLEAIVAVADVPFESVSLVAGLVVLLEEPNGRRSLADAAEDRLDGELSVGRKWHDGIAG